MARCACRYWAIWSDGPGKRRANLTPEQHRNVVPGHDQPGTRVSYSTSKDGLHWSKPADLTGPPRIDGLWPMDSRWRTAGTGEPFQCAGLSRQGLESGSIPLEQGDRCLAGSWHGSKRHAQQLPPQAIAIGPIHDDSARSSTAGLGNDRR